MPRNLQLPRGCAACDCSAGCAVRLQTLCLELLAPTHSWGFWRVGVKVGLRGGAPTRACGRDAKGLLSSRAKPEPARSPHRSASTPAQLVATTSQGADQNPKAPRNPKPETPFGRGFGVCPAPKVKSESRGPEVPKSQGPRRRRQAVGLTPGTAPAAAPLPRAVRGGVVEVTMQGCDCGAPPPSGNHLLGRPPGRGQLWAVSSAKPRASRLAPRLPRRRYPVTGEHARV